MFHLPLSQEHNQQLSSAFQEIISLFPVLKAFAQHSPFLIILLLFESELVFFEASISISLKLSKIRSEDVFAELRMQCVF